MNKLLLTALIFGLTSTAHATVYEKEITAQGDKTSHVQTYKTNHTLSQLNGNLNLSIAGIGSAGTGTISLERTLNGTTWNEVSEYTADIEKQLTDKDPNVRYRLKSNNFTSGTISVKLSNSIP